MIIHGFDLLKEQKVSEYNFMARFFRHTQTGAQLLSIENDDEIKVFAIIFRTPLRDSKGVAHIMEHSVLCGSEKYPVKEPFVELMKGSLNTFLNAFTFPDKTCYPVASQNLRDFYNLIDVYADAVFHPLIPLHTLQQEGCHFELDSLEAPLSYKGVVFNEMKGVYSNPDDLLQERVMQSLFPQSSYSYSVGGDPRCIPELTYAQFKAFHQEFYHPSNARFFFYGDDEPEERLRKLDGYLKSYKIKEADTSINLQSRFTQPRIDIFPYDPGDEEKQPKGMFVMNWMLTKTNDPVEILGLSILSHLLIGTPASPLRKSLIDSGLGEDLAGVGLDTDIQQVYFSTGLKGVATNPDYSLVDQGKIESLIVQTLNSLARDGIETEAVEASLNTIEFRLRENNTGNFPRGLSLLLRSLTTWLYDGDPITPLAFEGPLDKIKEHIASGEKYFEGLIQSYFLENPHRTSVILKPKPGLSEHEKIAEKNRLANIRSAMSENELRDVLEDTSRLIKLQETPDTPEALGTVPGLSLDDLERENKFIPMEISDWDGCQVINHKLNTNEIVYLDVGLDLHTLPQEYLPYIPLFGRALIEMGTETEEYVKLSQRIGKYTGGIVPITFSSMTREKQRIFERDKGLDFFPYSTAWLFLRSKATVPQTETLLAILRDILVSVQLDNHERFLQMVLEEKASRESMLIPFGHKVVNTRLRAMFNEADWAEEQMSGISNLFFVRELVEEVKDRWISVLEILENIRCILLNTRTMICNVTLDIDNYGLVEPQLKEFFKGLPSRSAIREVWQPTISKGFEGLIIPAQVNYVGKGADLYELGYQPDGSINVIIKYLSTTWLWERVRVKGGAYGGFCLFNHRSGCITYLSYRDPNLLDTLENYDLAAQYLQDLDLSKEELTKSIIGAIGDMDTYQLPDAKGFTSMQRYLTGDTDESRQRWREQILNTTQENFYAFGKALEQVREKGSVVVMGSPNDIKSASSLWGGWLDIKKVL